MCAAPVCGDREMGVAESGWESLAEKWWWTYSTQRPFLIARYI